MKKILTLFLFLPMLISCGDPEMPEAAEVLITRKPWVLDRFATTKGQNIANSDLNAQAVALFSMYYVFDANKFVTAFDRASNQTVDKGAWALTSDNKKMMFELVKRTLNFDVIEITSTQMVLESPTGNDLSGVGERVRLYFKPK